MFNLLELALRELIQSGCAPAMSKVKMCSLFQTKSAADKII